MLKLNGFSRLFPRDVQRDYKFDHDTENTRQYVYIFSTSDESRWSPHSPGFLRSPGSVPVEPLPRPLIHADPLAHAIENQWMWFPLLASRSSFLSVVNSLPYMQSFSEGPNPAGRALRPDPPPPSPDSLREADTKEFSVQLRLCISQPGPQPRAPVGEGKCGAVVFMKVACLPPGALTVTLMDGGR